MHFFYLSIDTAVPPLSPPLPPPFKKKPPTVLMYIQSHLSLLKKKPPTVLSFLVIISSLPSLIKHVALIVSYRVTSCHTVSHRVTSCHIVAVSSHRGTSGPRCDTMWHDVTRCDTVCHDVPRCDTMLLIKLRSDYFYENGMLHDQTLTQYFSHFQSLKKKNCKSKHCLFFLIVSDSIIKKGILVPLQATFKMSRTTA